MVRIYADSTNDLGPELIARTGVKIIPLYVTIGDTTGRDGVEITPDGIYEWANKTKQTPKTAAFPPKDVEPFIKDAKAVGDDIIFIGISEEMSATCNVFRLAAQQQEYEDHTFVVDSRNLSTGIGLIILEAARLRDEGKSAAEIVEGLKTYIDRSRASFVIDTLVYLARGGRCSTVTALLASTLKIKPKIVVEKGAMHVANKYRGKMDAVYLKYAKDMEPALLKAEKAHVFITHSGVPAQDILAVKSYLESLHHFDEIHVTRAGSVISSHCGPGTLGVLFIAGKE